MYKSATERTEMGPKENPTIHEIPEDHEDEPIEHIAPLPWKVKIKLIAIEATLLKTIMKQSKYIPRIIY